ncbi:MAG: hypothetical protein IJ250_08050 [Bacteroidales bacterium]|nr:hypothetical protein [Bacteroidales bacterium]
MLPEIKLRQPHVVLFLPNDALPSEKPPFFTENTRYFYQKYPLFSELNSEVAQLKEKKAVFGYEKAVAKLIFAVERMAFFHHGS